MKAQIVLVNEGIMSYFFSEISINWIAVMGNIVMNIIVNNKS